MSTVAPQDPGAGRVAAFDRDDEVGFAAKPHEHVADVNALRHHHLEPVGLAVVFIQQIIGAYIGQVVPFGIDDPQIRKGPMVFIEHIKHRPQPSALDQILPVVGLGDQFQFGTMFLHEQFDDLAVVLHFVAKGRHDP